MKLDSYIADFHAINAALKRSIFEDDRDEILQLDGLLSNTVEHLLEFDPATPADREKLFVFLLRLLRPEPETGSFEDRVERRLIELNCLGANA